MKQKTTLPFTEESRSVRPLEGRLILDCSTLLPGPFVGKLLMLQGAHVIKVESPQRPDPARQMSGGSYYRDLNEGKELVWLDLTNAQDKIKFEALVKKAHGLVEGFRPQGKKKLGLEASRLHSINPSLCISSIVGYPEGSELKDRAAHDINFQADTGCLFLFGGRMPALPLADLFGAWECALSMAAMLDASARGRLNQRRVTSLAGALVEAQSVLIQRFRDSGEEPQYGSTLMSGVYPCYRPYVASDGVTVAVGAIEHKFWLKFCEMIEMPEMIELGYSTGKEGERVISAVQKKIAENPGAHWAQVFADIDCCVNIAKNYGKIF